MEAQVWLLGEKISSEPALGNATRHSTTPLRSVIPRVPGRGGDAASLDHGTAYQHGVTMKLCYSSTTKNPDQAVARNKNGDGVGGGYGERLLSYTS